MLPSEVQDLVDAADRAGANADPRRAIELYTEALDLVADDEDGGRSIRLRRGLALIEIESFEDGASELGDLLPELDGRDELEALLGLARASMWLERTDEALAFAERSLGLAESIGDQEMLGPALAALSQVYGQRGREGDLGRALELGDRALAAWVPGARAADLAAHEGLQALTHYWCGGYARAAELGRRGGDGASAGLALAALGRHEEALEVFDAAIASQRARDSTIGTAYALNCSTAALRDLIDLTEARRRNEEAAELFRRIPFESGVMQSEIDLLYTDLVDEDAGNAERAWPVLWERLNDATGWERWLAPGRLSVAWAEIALGQQRWDAAIERARDAIEIARRIGREKYEVSARIVLGTAMHELDRDRDAAAELKTAAAAADRHGHPPTRWQAHASLGQALRGVGNDEGAATASHEAAEIVQGFAASLASGRAEPVLGSPRVQEILRAG